MCFNILSPVDTFDVNRVLKDISANVGHDVFHNLGEHEGIIAVGKGDGCHSLQSCPSLRRLLLFTLSGLFRWWTTSKVEGRIFVAAVYFMCSSCQSFSDTNNLVWY